MTASPKVTFQQVGQPGSYLVNILLGRHQGGQQADGPAAGHIDQQPFLLDGSSRQFLASAIQLDAHHQSLSAYFGDAGQRTDRLTQALDQASSEPISPLRQFVARRDFEHLATHPAGERIAAESGTMAARGEHQG